MNEQNVSLPAALPSPRIVGGVLKWYEGDTFRLQVTIELTDENGASLTIGEKDTVSFQFYDKRGRQVRSMMFGGIQNNCVELRFDQTTTKSFSKGDYTYDAYYSYGQERRTLVRNAPIRVE